MFSTHSKKNFCFSGSFILLSAYAFNLDQSKKLSFGKELRHNIVAEVVHNYYCFEAFLHQGQNVDSTFPKRQILDSSEMKEFADDTFKFDENGRKFSKRVETTGKRRNCWS